METKLKYSLLMFSKFGGAKLWVSRNMIEGSGI